MADDAAEHNAAKLAAGMFDWEPMLANDLVCPLCRSNLSLTGRTLLTCCGCGAAFAVRLDGVPELMKPVPEWTEPPGLLGRIAANPRLYDLVQRTAGRRRIQHRLRKALAGAEGVLLDVGAGTGSVETLLPAPVRYLWLDPDPAKLTGFRAKSKSPAILADATRLPLRDRAVEWSVSIAVSHHLDDEHLARMLDELRRVTNRRLVFLDALETPRLLSRAMWQMDRGHHARTADVLRLQLERRFRPIHVEEFQILHRYLLFVGA
jgi:SAM-dependent methyltransferase